MEITAILIVLAIFVVAVLYSSVGHAGASGYLAVMAFWAVAPEVTRPTALVLNLFVATIGTVQFYRAGYFSWRIFLPFAVASIPMAFIGGRIHLPTDVYKMVLGAVLCLAAAAAGDSSEERRSGQGSADNRVPADRGRDRAAVGDGRRRRRDILDAGAAADALGRDARRRGRIGAFYPGEFDLRPGR